jgi:2-(1,2-epoxy-1,2-dihydrophenyl)acetyl-CoA isomerase
MTYETILTEINDGVLTVTMNRPERLNAWTYQMGAEMQSALEAANANNDVGAIVFTGAGRGFCAGADIQDLFKTQADSGEVGGSATGQPRDWVGLLRESKPCIAAVNGAAIGVGLTQILPMDYIIASNEAKLSARFVKMGLVPELASSHFLAARCGFGAASELMLTGRIVLAEEAQQLRMIDKVVSAQELLPTAVALAQDMGSNPQSSLRSIKQLLSQNMMETDLKQVQLREGEALAQCYKSPEHHEAINAFLEKRDPDFKKARSAE